MQITDIVEVIGERVSLSRKGREFVGVCPFHDDHKPSMYVTPSKQIFKCFSCGAGGDAIKFVQLFERLSFREAIESLARRAGLDLRSNTEDRQRLQARDALARVMSWATKYFQRNLRETPNGRRALEYAHKRGLSDETIERFGLGFAPDAWDGVLSAGRRAKIEDALLRDAGLVTTNESGRVYDRFRNRLMFPIRDAMGRVIAFGGRTLGDDPAKYLNSPETALFSKSRVLYAFDVARDVVTRQSQAIVVEGYMDAVLLHQHGVGNAIATLGTALTDAHVKLLKPLLNDLVLCFDGDDAGQRAADRGVETAVRHSLAARVCILEDGMDPADFVTDRGREAFESALSLAVDALEFKWRATASAVEHGEQRSRRTAIESYLNFVASCSVGGHIDPIEHGMLVGRIGDVLSLPTDEIYALLARARRGARRPPDAGGSADDVDSGPYAQAVAELPRGLVLAVESMFELLLTDARCFEWLDETFAKAAGCCDVWQRLLDVMTGLVDEQGRLTREDVIGRCDEEDLLDLLRAAREHHADLTDLETTYRMIGERIHRELDAIKETDLRSRLGVVGNDPQHARNAFASLVQLAKRRSGFLPSQAR